MSKYHNFVGFGVVCAITASFAVTTSATKPPIPLKCNGAKIKSVLRASSGSFSIKSGLAVEKLSGNIGRSALKVKRGCLIEAKPGDNIILTFDEKHKNKLRFSNKFEMQCVDAVNPNGKFLGYHTAPKPSTADGKYWTPPCSAEGLNKLEKKACSKGASNSDRKDHWKKMSKKKKTFSLGFFITDDFSQYSQSDEPYVGNDRTSVTAAEVAPSGKVFCQYYSKEDKNAVFGLIFDLPKK